MKKLLSLLLAFGLVFTLVACGQETTKEEEKPMAEEPQFEDDGVITIWAWDPNFNIAIMEEAKAIYLEANPDVKFEIVDMAKADLEQQLHVMLQSGTTKGLPDIVLIEDYNAQKYLLSYPDAFAPLNGGVDHSNFLPYKVALSTVENNVYSVPFDTGASGFYYRTDLLEQAGYTHEDLVNITWDEYIAIGQDVKAKTGAAMLAHDFADGGLMRVILNSTGSWYFDENGSPSFVGNEGLKGAIETYKKIYDTEIYKPTKGWGEWVGALNDGSAASVVTGVWITGSVKAGADQSGNWAVAPTPRLDLAGSVNASNLGGSSWYVLKSGDVEMSTKFLNDIYATNEDFYQKILVNQGAVGSYLPAASGEAYSTEDEFFGGQTVFADFAKWGSEIPEINYGLYTYEADDAIFAFLPQYLDGTITVDELLEQAEAQTKSQIGQ